MGCSTPKRVNANLEASNVKWGLKHCRIISPVADVLSSLNNTYFDLNGFDPNLNELPFYVWFNVNAAGTDPAIAGKTGIEIEIAENASVSVILAALKAALDALSPVSFVSSIKLNSLEVQNKFIGKVTLEVDSGASGFGFEVGIEGVGVDLGATADAIEISFEGDSVDITSNQTGNLVLDQIFLGNSASLSANLIEVTKEKVEILFGKVTGDTLTPMGGTTVTGGGEGKLFQSLAALGGMLILHPIRLPEDDYSADWVFWRSAPKPESINFDGTAPQQLAISFTAYLDGATNKKINLFARGDWTQEGLNA